MNQSGWFVTAELMGSAWCALDNPENAELLGKLKSCPIVIVEFPEPIVHAVIESTAEVERA